MSGIMFHRLSDNQQSLAVENSQTIVDLPSSSEAFVQETGNSDQRKKVKHIAANGQKRPPVAFASVAPFPFLPAPSYANY